MLSEQSEHLLSYLSVDDLVPNDWNPQHQDDTVFDRLVDEIEDVGFIDPIQVVAQPDNRYLIIGGEHRWQAAKAAGMEEVPCIVLEGDQWKEEDLQKFVTVRLNLIRGRLNPEKFLKLYNEMVARYGEESMQGLMGHCDTHGFKKLVDSVKKGMKDTLPKDLQDKFDEEAKEVKTVEDLSNIIQSLYNSYGDTVSQSFMVFTYGKQSHIYISMDKGMKKAMDKILSYCKTTGDDINEFMAPIVQTFMKEAESRLSE